jgi:HEAT repeat protein
MKTTTMSVREYCALDQRSRVSYLDQHVSDSSTDLSEDFVIDALSKENDPLAKWFLVKACGFLRSTAAIPLLIRVCKEPDTDFRETSLHAICAWSLGKIGEAAFDAVLGLARAADPETRKCAVDALGELRDVRAIDVLCSALQHDQHEVQLWAGLSLAKMGNSALNCLERVVSSSTGDTREIALDAIQKIRDRSLVSAKLS